MNQPTLETLHPGQVIADRYEIVRELGRGGMGVVYEALQLDLHLHVAVKVLHDPAPHRESRFAREARVTALLRSEHVVRVLDYGTIDGQRPFFVMERLQGCSLGAELRRSGPMSPGTAVDLILEAAVGLSEAHAKRIVHRDLKPSNLFLAQGEDGTSRVKVLDFGVAKAVLADSCGPVTETCATLGTPAYMSPEQLRDARQADARSDVWSLGVILYELLSARLPFAGETPTAVIAAIAADKPLPLLPPSAPVAPELDLIIRRCLRKDASERFPTVAALACSLAPFGSARGERALQSIRGLAGRHGGEWGNCAVTRAEQGRDGPSSEADGTQSTLGALSKAVLPQRRRPHYRWVALGGLLALSGLGAGFLALRSSPASTTTNEALRAPPMLSGLSVINDPSTANTTALASDAPSDLTPARSKVQLRGAQRIPGPVALAHPSASPPTSAPSASSHSASSPPTPVDPLLYRK